MDHGPSTPSQSSNQNYMKIWVWSFLNLILKISRLNFGYLPPLAVCDVVPHCQKLESFDALSVPKSIFTQPEFSVFACIVSHTLNRSQANVSWFFFVPRRAIGVWSHKSDGTCFQRLLVHVYVTFSSVYMAHLVDPIPYYPLVQS